jgi:hypothetical protein
VQRRDSIPAGVSITTAPAAPERITASVSVTSPVASEVRRTWTRRPSEASSRLPGESSIASRFFSTTPSGRPVTIALCGRIPPATPSKRMSASPAGMSTVRRSVIRA